MSRRTITGHQLLAKARAIRDKQTALADLEEDLAITLDLLGGIEAMPDLLIEKLADNLRGRYYQSLWVKLHEEKQRRERLQLSRNRDVQPSNGKPGTVRRLGARKQPLLLEA